MVSQQYSKKDHSIAHLGFNYREHQGFFFKQCCLMVMKIWSHFLSCCFGLQQFLDLRVAVLGNVDSGKSTLLGVLTQGELDNGRGRARLNLFRHLHEIQTGRTSSISFEILGFNSKGEVIPLPLRILAIFRSLHSLWTWIHATLRLLVISLNWAFSRVEWLYSIHL